MRYYRRSSGPGNEQVLEEILDSESEKANRLSKQGFRLIKP